MGLSRSSTEFVIQAWKADARFDQTLTLGRQHMLVSPERLEAMLRKAGAWPPPEGPAAFRQSLASSTWRFETFARALGAQSVTACDASDFEGATFIHDLNQPVAADVEKRYDLVLDGGTLEHVFNFPVAIQNCMRMVKVGGHLILLTPTNNYCGHGFYQFSPELFYRVLSADNGFRVKRMVALVDNAVNTSFCGLPYPFPISGPWYEVKDPAAVRTRVTLVNNKPAMLMVFAERLEERVIFEKPPQQSDYVPEWEHGGGSPAVSSTLLKGRTSARLIALFGEDACRVLLPRLVGFLDPFRYWRYRRQNSFANRTLYERSARSVASINPEKRRLR